MKLLLTLLALTWLTGCKSEAEPQEDFAGYMSCRVECADSHDLATTHGCFTKESQAAQEQCQRDAVVEHDQCVEKCKPLLPK